MRYTVVTPTLLRATLARLCRSLDEQSDTDWQHVVVVDTLERDEGLLAAVLHPQRQIVLVSDPASGWASACAARRDAYPHATGDYLIYIDDDNYLADREVLATLRFATQPVVLFSLLYRGRHEPPLPIKVGRSDTNQLMVDRRIGQWPENGDRTGDGVFIQRLTDEYAYEVYGDRPLVVYEQENRGMA